MKRSYQIITKSFEDFYAQIRIERSISPIKNSNQFLAIENKSSSYDNSDEDSMSNNSCPNNKRMKKLDFNLETPKNKKDFDVSPKEKQENISDNYQWNSESEEN